MKRSLSITKLDSSNQENLINERNPRFKYRKMVSLKSANSEKEKLKKDVVQMMGRKHKCMVKMIFADKKDQDKKIIKMIESLGVERNKDFNNYELGLIKDYILQVVMNKD